VPYTVGDLLIDITKVAGVVCIIIGVLRIFTKKKVPPSQVNAQHQADSPPPNKGDTVDIDTSTAKQVGQLLSGLSAEYGKFGQSVGGLSGFEGSLLADAESFLNAPSSTPTGDKVIVDRPVVERACSAMTNLAEQAKKIGVLQRANEFGALANNLRSALSSSKVESPTDEVDFYQYTSGIPEKVGLCSDRACPCPETPIPRGTGYLYISEEAVSFMRSTKTFRTGASGGSAIVMGPMPILVCEQGAKLRGIDLEVAAADARRWWETGKVPLRPTPLCTGNTATKEERQQAEEEKKRREEQDRDMWKILGF
jgi:hypothetical protein